jgi:hypothetical protein
LPSHKQSFWYSIEFSNCFSFNQEELLYSSFPELRNKHFSIFFWWNKFN